MVLVLMTHDYQIFQFTHILRKGITLGQKCITNVLRCRNSYF